MTIFKKKSMLFGIVVSQLAMMAVTSPVLAHTNLSQTDSSVLGGWSEDIGQFQTTSDTIDAGVVSVRAARNEGKPRHGGMRENRYPSKYNRESRAVGWTTWTDVYHYTRAQMVSGFGLGAVASDSERVWGWHGTEAYSGWVYEGEIGTHRAKTFYGR